MAAEELLERVRSEVASTKVEAAIATALELDPVDVRDQYDEVISSGTYFGREAVREIGPVDSLIKAGKFAIERATIGGLRPPEGTLEARMQDAAIVLGALELIAGEREDA